MIKIAQGEHTSDRAKQLLKGIAKGVYDGQAVKEGIDLASVKANAEKQGYTVKPSILSNVVAPFVADAKKSVEGEQAIEAATPDAPNVANVLTSIQGAKEGARNAARQPVAQPEEAGIVENQLDLMANMGAHGASKLGTGLGNVADMINPVSYLQKALGDENTFGSLIKDAAQAPLDVQKQLGTDQSQGGKIGAVAGDVLGTVAEQVPLLVTGSEILSGLKTLPKFQALAKLMPDKASKIADFIAKSLGTTTAITATEEGKLPSAGEAAAYGAVDAALFGLGKLGTTLYRSAFKGSKTVEKDLIKSFDKTVADTAEELGYVGSEKQIIDQAKKAKNTVYEQIKALAKKNKPVTREKFINTVLPKLTKNFDNLPDSTVKDQLKQTLKEVVENYAPKKSATGTELTGILGQINKGLFGEGQRAVLTPKQIASAESQLKKGVKDLLPEEVKPLYETYAKNRLIEQVMQDERVKRLVGRTLLGGTTGAISGAASSDDAIEALKRAIVGGIIGSAGFALTGNVKMATGVGNQLKKAAKTEVSIVAKNIVNKFLEELGLSDQ